jgi:glycosyltransferase involved in cell wall biosynthesis
VSAVDFSLVVACYNASSYLEDSVEETFRVLDALRWTSEVIFVDDCSTDDTVAVIEKLVAAHPTRALQVLKHPVNVGRGGTVTDGIRVARGRFAGFLDIDLEVHARYLLPCLLALEGGADVTTAHRIYRFQWRSLDRHLLSRGYLWLMQRMIAVPLADTETGFKIFRRDRILPVLDACQDRGWFWDTEVMVRAHYAGLRVTEIPALFLRRFDKQSSVRAVRDSLDYLARLWQFRAVVRQLREKRALGAPAGAERGNGAPASDRVGGAGGAKPPGQYR